MEPTQEELDEQARAAAEAQMRALDDVGAQTRDALSPVTSPDAQPRRTVELPEMRIEAPATPDEPQELPNRDHLGHIDPTSGSVFGPDWPEGDAIAPEDRIPPATPEAPAPPSPAAQPSAASALASPVGDRNSEVFGMATDADPVLPGIMHSDEPEAVDNPQEEAAESPALRALGDEQAPEPARLDAGLPTEEQIGAAHTSDDWRHVLHALGAGLAAAGGVHVAPFESRAEPLEAERRAGLRAALGAKAASRAQEAMREATTTRQRIQDALAERRVAAAERTADAMTPARVAALEATTERTRAQTDAERLSTQFSAATREERQSPESGLSRGYQAAVRQRAALIGTEPPADLDQQSAEQLEPQMRAMMQGVGVRRGAGGGGGGGAGGDAAADRMAQLFVDHGISPDVDTARAEIEALDQRRGGAAGVLAGRLSEETIAAPGATTQGAIAATNTSLGEVQRILSRYPPGTDIPGVGLIDSHVPTLALSSEGRELRGALLDLSNNYLRMVSGAAVPQHEVEEFADRLGAYDESQFRRAVTRLESEIRARSQGATSTTARPQRTPRATARGAPEGGTVRMLRPDGVVVPNVPASSVERATARGWRLQP